MKLKICKTCRYKQGDICRYYNRLLDDAFNPVCKVYVNKNKKIN